MEDKLKRKQTFLKSYLAKYPFIKACTSKSVTDNSFYAHCVVCKCDIYIGSAGASDIKRHEKVAKHVQNAKFMSNASEQPRLHLFMKNRQNSIEQQEELDRKEREAKEKAEAEAKEKKLQEDTIRAEAMMVELISSLNLSINSATTLTQALKLMFPDSEIAQRFQCGRTKTTAIVKDLAAKHQTLLLDRMKNYPFSLATDGSNDSNSKLYPIVVRSVDPETLTVNAEVVSLPVLEESATGENIFNLLDKLLAYSDIPWENCVAFGCDNASVMTGVYRGVFAFIKKKDPNCVLAGCTLHLVHLAAEKAAHLLPYQPADLLLDIFHYMKKSSVRQRNLNLWQEYYNQEQRKVLKHISTRWLSISKCIDRLVEDWRPLRSYFEEEKQKTKAGSAANVKAKAIHDVLKSETAKLCALFMKYTVKLFNPFLTANQSDAPKIQQLQNSMCKLMSEILSKFVKPSACCFKGPFDIEFDITYNIKDLNEVCLGSDADKFIKEKKYSKQNKEEFQKHAIEYYKSVCKYLKDNLPHDDKFVSKISCSTPDNLTQPQSITKLKYIMREQPIFIPKGANFDIMESQLCRMQLLILEDKLPQGDRLDQIWAKQALADEDTKFACLFLLNLLVVPHSSASCERVFSYVRKFKTDQRGKMGDSLLEALIVTKTIPEHPLTRQHSSETLKFLKSSCKRALEKEETDK